MVTLPIIAAMIAFVAPTNAATVNPPAGLCAAKNWVSCSSGNYYCKTLKGASCSNLTWSERPNGAMENWSQKQATSTKVAVGKTVSSSSVAKVTYKYVWRYKYVIKNHKKVKSWYKVKVAVT